VLLKACLLHQPGMLLAEFGQLRCIAVAQRHRPVQPGCLAMHLTNRLVQCVIIEPVRLHAPECREGGFLFRCRGRLETGAGLL
jgi:predicted HD phosphohydrolase